MKDHDMAARKSCPFFFRYRSQREFGSVQYDHHAAIGC